MTFSLKSIAWWFVLWAWIDIYGITRYGPQANYLHVYAWNVTSIFIIALLITAKNLLTHNKTKELIRVR